MLLKSIFSGLGLIVSKKQLDASSLRQKAIANNIANVNTPGFKRSDVSFEENLQKAISEPRQGQLRTTNSKHISNPSSPSGIRYVQPALLSDNSSTTRLDGNNVDIDKEMVGLAQNQIKFESFTRIIASKYRGLKSVVSDGRR